MQIVFNPPLGDTVRVKASSLLSQTQPSPLLFTASLNVQDYEQLMRDGGCVQLWSDLPRNGQPDGAWSDLDFKERGYGSKRPASAYMIPLSGSLPVYDHQEITLYLPISLPPYETRRFSFTYRIVYPSGHVAWLGAFGRNGSFVFEHGDLNSSYGLVLKNGWSIDLSHRSHTFKVENASSFDVATVVPRSDFRIWALGKERFLPSLKNASVVFFVPRPNRRSLDIHPTYVMTASPGLLITVASDGHIAVSGSGIVMLRVCELQSDLRSFIQEIMIHSQLDGWSTLAADSGSKSVVLGSSRARHHIAAAIIPLWPSEHSDAPLHVKINELLDAFGSDNPVCEFALISTYNLKMHIFCEGIGQAEYVALQFDSTNSEFTLSPIYKLRTAIPDSKATWAAAILNPHDIVPSPSGDHLPTPPPSPHIQPIVHVSRPSDVSIDTSISSVDTLPLDVDQPSQDDDGHVAEPSHTRIAPSSLGPKVVRRRPSARLLIPFLFKTVMAFFIRFFCPIFLFRFPATRLFPGGRQSPAKGEEEVSNVDNNAPPTMGEQDRGEPDPNITLVDSVTPSTENHTPSDTDEEAEHATSTEKVVSGSGEVMVYAELHHNEEMGSEKSTATVALFPVPMFENMTRNDEDGTPVHGPDVRVEGSVKFFDGSRPEYTLSKCDVTTVKDHESSVTSTCYLLEYQLEFRNSQNRKLIGISSPVNGAS